MAIEVCRLAFIDSIQQADGVASVNHGWLKYAIVTTANQRNLDDFSTSWRIFAMSELRRRATPHTSHNQPAFTSPAFDEKPGL
jgi:hypothetical protein